VAQTIRKDKGSTTRARTSPDMEDAQMATPIEDEPRDDDELPEDAEADVGDDEVLTPEDAEAINRALARSPQTVVAPTRRGVVMPSFMYGNPVTRYIAESITELSKVTAPTTREAWNMTLVVIAFSTLIALILGLADLALLRGLTWLINLGH
jgi:preprotein translocase SecE subunit